MGPMFEASRDAGLVQLATFVPHAGSDYARDRNFDFGPDRRTNVSLLSPYLRHRLIGEAEAVRAVLRPHRIGGAAKFVEEVCWRTYWKGWLEQRPGVWDSYLADLASDTARVQGDADLAARLAQACAGQTGITAFDAWISELVETGYLHNHARMWFASIWIFTLGLPWTLGADFFYRHLIDGDPASNTLSWRWVAGLHTPGKAYVARAENIRTFTGGRFDPAGQLNEDPQPLAGPDLPAPMRLRSLMSVPDGLPVVLLVGEDDVTPEQWPVAHADIRGVAVLPPDTRYPALAVRVIDFRVSALADAGTRAQTAFGCPVVTLADPLPDGLKDFCAAQGVEDVVTMQVPAGPSRTTLNGLIAGLGGSGLTLREVRRDWDGAFWPYARQGFFKLKERIPETLERLGLV